jgi:hypothetical protein
MRTGPPRHFQIKKGVVKMEVQTTIKIKMNECEKEILFNFADALTEACGRSSDCRDCPYYEFLNEYNPCPVDQGLILDIIKAFSK